MSIQLMVPVIFFVIRQLVGLSGTALTNLVPSIHPIAFGGFQTANAQEWGHQDGGSWLAGCKYVVYYGDDERL